jgi:hypothetical protein
MTTRISIKVNPAEDPGSRLPVKAGKKCGRIILKQLLPTVHVLVFALATFSVVRTKGIQIKESGLAG